MAGFISVQGDEALYYSTPELFTRRIIAGTPERLEVSDSRGVAATLTAGAKTVTVRGPQRRFIESKRPFLDDFARTPASGWGVSPGGGSWVSANGPESAYSVTGGVGTILLDTVNQSRHVTLRDNNIGDVDVIVRTTIDKAPTGAGVGCALSFGYQGTSNSYRARLLFSSVSGGVQLALEKEAAGTVTVLGAATPLGSGFLPGDWWNIRAQKSGSTLRCRAWKDGTPEPVTWTHTATDTTFTTGRVGVRALVNSGNTSIPLNARFDDLRLISGAWVNAPAVTHATWVRVLDEPFDGTWNEALATQVRAWLVDRTPDALAYAWCFITDAPAVGDPLLEGKRIFGQSDYGPLKSDGTRYETSDWTDYVGTSWTYPNGEARPFPHGSITTSGAMDCSGFVRMVYGRCMGLPMSYSRDYDGLNIPRATRNMSPYGPGVIVAAGTDAPPASLDSLQVGDVVFFDADATEEVEGQIDHCGIYVGVDSYGSARFISSRKTVNGPTISDLGGPSTLNGGSNYAKRLRTVRRF
ncbi:hypothetical protein GPA10_22365 [Streptomyces sp. p1417]|uniref:NlpC/P60 domain-containing protein n=1 Tax=Streptomyces typhae TaxID=2681492 RepID=A0A6L6X173_9ACTN|nr:NlpC/P60 family protein [Streptomyces typhae]MVO87430.1 hypothetical protein [Streptomyces typhae]